MGSALNAAVRELENMLDIKGIVITVDAMHCQKETVQRIIENKGDYVLQLKANQKKYMKTYMLCGNKLSERELRNVKNKPKISRYFKSIEGANIYNNTPVTISKLRIPDVLYSK